MKWVSDPNLAHITAWLAIVEMIFFRKYANEINGLVQVYSNSSTLGMGLLQSCNNPQIIVLLWLSKALTITLYTSWLWSEQGIAKHPVFSATFHHRRYAKFA